MLLLRFVQIVGGEGAALLLPQVVEGLLVPSFLSCMVWSLRKP